MKEPIDNVLSRLKSVVKINDGKWSALCPVNVDHEQSLFVTTTDEGNVLLHCSEGCRRDYILHVMKLGARDLLAQSMREYKPRKSFYQSDQINYSKVLRLIRNDIIDVYIVAELIKEHGRLTDDQMDMLNQAYININKVLEASNVQ